MTRGGCLLVGMACLASRTIGPSRSFVTEPLAPAASFGARSEIKRFLLWRRAGALFRRWALGVDVLRLYGSFGGGWQRTG